MAKSRKRSVPDTPATADDQATQSPAAVANPKDTGQSSAFAEPARKGGDHRERVAQRAYELYLSRGGAHGSDWEDWLAAERRV